MKKLCKAFKGIGTAAFILAMFWILFTLSWAALPSTAEYGGAQCQPTETANYAPNTAY